MLDDSRQAWMELAERHAKLQDEYLGCLREYNESLDRNNELQIEMISIMRKNKEEADEHNLTLKAYHQLLSRIRYAQEKQSSG